MFPTVFISKMISLENIKIIVLQFLLETVNLKDVCEAITGYFSKHYHTFQNASYRTTTTIAYFTKLFQYF